MLENPGDIWRIDNDHKLGRFGRANRHINAGEIIIDELPFVIGPKPSTSPICLGCYDPVDGSDAGPRCKRCCWPLCNECQLIVDQTHHVSECQIFVESRSKFQNFPSKDACMQLDCIMPLRLLLRKESDPLRWHNEIMPMEYHPNERSNSETYHVDAINVVGYLHGPCRLRDRFSTECIQRTCGILEVNSFEARTRNNQRIRCLYTKAAIMAHSCKPNVTHTILPSDNFR